MGEVRETDYLHLATYEAVSKFKSVRRAIRRNHVPLMELHILRDLSVTPILRKTG